MLYRITTSYFCCGLVTDDTGLITDAAPIMYWSIGKKLESVRWWVSGKNGTVEECHVN